jgi:hypothetical protein
VTGQESAHPLVQRRVGHQLANELACGSDGVSTTCAEQWIHGRVARTEDVTSHTWLPFRLSGMSLNLRRLILAFLTVAGAYTGLWAYFAPRHWFRHYPGFGLSWLPQLGPYNEHLSKDAGAMFMALTVLSLIALRSARNDTIARIAGLVWLTFNTPHLIYHMQHLDMYNTRDQILNVVTLGLLAVASVALLLPVSRRRS